MKSSFEQIPAGILTLLIGVSLLCCIETVERKDTEAFSESLLKVIDDEQDHFLSNSIVDSVRNVTEINRGILPFDGRLFSSVSWNDKLGGNVLVISESGTYDEGNGRKEIFLYHYLKRDSIYDVLWQMNDFVDGRGCDLDIQIINFFPLISDIDSNGIAESAIFYSMNNRCDAGAFPVNLIVHEGKGKFIITGIRDQYLDPPEELMNEYRAKDGLPPLQYKNIVQGYSKLDTSIINYYSYQWDNFINLENKLEGALPNDLIKIIN